MEPSRIARSQCLLPPRFDKNACGNYVNDLAFKGSVTMAISWGPQWITLYQPQVQWFLGLAEKASSKTKTNTKQTKNTQKTLWSGHWVQKPHGQGSPSGQPRAGCFIVLDQPRMSGIAPSVLDEPCPLWPWLNRLSVPDRQSTRRDSYYTLIKWGKIMPFTQGVPSLF